MGAELFAILLLPAGLGILGFVEPCTIGGHLLFLGSQRLRTPRQRARGLVSFVVARLLVMGGIGGLIVFVGHQVIGAQKTAWIMFGAIYLFVGLFFVLGRGGWMRHGVQLAPDGWKRAENPVLMGLALGLNIPACAAPILFGLMGLAAAGANAATGFVMMATFALALSLPLVPLSLVPSLAERTARLAGWMRGRRWFAGAIFMLLGLWAIWFGLFVDPADWSGL